MFAHDPSVFVDPDVFGERVIRTDTSAFYAMFDLAYVDALDTQALEPVLMVPTSTPVAIGEVLTVRGVAYRVRVLEPDGHGMVTCRMTTV